MAGIRSGIEVEMGTRIKPEIFTYIGNYGTNETKDV